MDFFNAYKYAHSAIIDSFVIFFGYRFHSRNDFLAAKKIDTVLTRFFNYKSGGFSVDTGPDFESYTVDNDWKAFDVFIDKGSELNIVKEFNNFDQFVACVNPEYGRYYEESCAYAFPAVAYSRQEMECWFLWCLKWYFRNEPKERGIVLDLAQYFIDVEKTTALMRRKLACEIPWEYGPARIREPNFDLWHQQTRDKVMNAELLKWLD